MSSLLGAALNSGAARNAGQSSGLLGGPGAIDGSMQSFWNIADPANLTGNASSGHILSNIFDPGNVFGMNQAANPYGPGGVGSQNGTNGGVPSVLPNLGAHSMIPQTPQGGFMPLGQTNPTGGNGGGIFNQMAANSAGPLFSPGYQNPKGANNQMHVDPINMILNKANPQQGNMGGNFLSSPAARNLDIGNMMMPRGTYQR